MAGCGCKKNKTQSTVTESPVTNTTKITNQVNTTQSTNTHPDEVDLIIKKIKELNKNK